MPVSTLGKELVLYRPQHLPAPLYERTAADVAARVEGLVSMAFRVDTAERQAGRSIHRVTISGIKRCLKQTAFAVSGTPRTEPVVPEEAREAAIGTWIHLYLLPLMRRLTPGAQIEKPVVLHADGFEVPGKLDWLWVGADGWCEVGDLKTVKEWKLNKVDYDGVFEEHEYQVWGYALGCAQLGYKVRWVWFLYLDRSSGQIRVKCEEFTNEKAFAVLQRIALIRSWSARPDSAPREGRGPGLSPVCDYCPWLTRCWGPDARRGRRGAQSILAISIEGIAEALGLLYRSNKIKNQAERDADFAKLVLNGLPSGTYGSHTLRYRSTGRAMNQAAVRQDYASRGIEVPTTEKSKAVIVSPVRP